MLNTFCSTPQCMNAGAVVLTLIWLIDLSLQIQDQLTIDLNVI